MGASVTSFTFPNRKLHVGENVPIKIQMNNKECKKRLDEYRVVLKQKVSYQVGSRRESYEK